MSDIAKDHYARVCMGCATACDGESSQLSFYQCPLCQAIETGEEDQSQRVGFFCSQECFATNWMHHRDTSHPKATVEQKKKKQEKNSQETDEPLTKEERKKQKPKNKQKGIVEARDDDNDEEEGEEDDDILPPWIPLPSAIECRDELQCAIVQPPLSLYETKKAVIACSSAADPRSDKMPSKKSRRLENSRSEDLEEEDEKNEAEMTSLWWSAATSASHFLRSSFDAHVQQPSKEKKPVVIVVVAGDALTAHAFAWAARCAGLSGHLRLHVEEQDETNNATIESLQQDESGTAVSEEKKKKGFPCEGFFVVVTTEHAYHKVEASSVAVSTLSSPASPWLKRGAESQDEEASGILLLRHFLFSTANDTAFAAHRLLLTLPDVSDPEELQRVHLPAFFFVGKDDEEVEDAEETAYTHHLNCFPSSQFSWMKKSFRMGSALLQLDATKVRNEEDNEESEDDRISWELDDRASTCLANGDTEGAVQYLVERFHSYQNTKGMAMSGRGGVTERVRRLLLHTMRCDWGALDVAHAHHRYMDLARSLLHQDEGFTRAVLLPNSGAGSSNHHGSSVGSIGSTGRSLADITLKALYATCSTLPYLPTAATSVMHRMISPHPAFTQWRESMYALLPSLEQAVVGNPNSSQSGSGSKTNARKRSRHDTSTTGSSSSTTTTVKQNLSDLYLSGVPHVQLHAFLSHIFPYIISTSTASSTELELEESPKALFSVSGRRLLDCLGKIWGVERVLPGCQAVRTSMENAKKALKKLTSRNTTTEKKEEEQHHGNLTPATLVVVLSALQRAVERVELHLGIQQPPAEARYVVMVLCVVYDLLSGSLTIETTSERKMKALAPMPVSLSLEELQRRLQWNRTALGSHVGGLREFLTRVELLHPEEEKKTGGNARAAERKRAPAATLSLSSRQTAAMRRQQAAQAEAMEQRLTEAQQRAVAYFASQPVHLPSTSPATSSSSATVSCLASLSSTTVPGTATSVLPYTELPISTVEAQRRQQLRRMAAEEIMSAMPKAVKPMYVGDVGNLIGKWNHFNAKYDGALGVRLLDFLIAFPKLWRVVDNIVTRTSAGSVEPVRIRHDTNENFNDSDEDENGAGQRRQQRSEDRAALTGLKGGKSKKWRSKKETAAKREAQLSEKSSKARKKHLRKAFNQSRTNRNYKQIDPSARVPGYVKRENTKTKGRGKKVNIRNYKRGN